MQDYLLFAGAFFVSVATPGPDIMVVVSKALAGNSLPRCLLLILGILLGKLLLLGAALLGLSALAITLGPLFAAIKFAGAAYLAFLGIRIWRRAPRNDVQMPVGVDRPAGEAALGLAMSLGNPLAILFYAALLPNVIDVTKVTLAGAAGLATIVVICTVAVYSAYAIFAGRMGSLFRSPSAQRTVNRTSGVALIGAAALVAAR